MLRAVWKTAYETGHPRIDFEHRIFFDLILQIERDLAEDQPFERVRRHLMELYKYADFHFFSEESIMIDVDYPDIATHRRTHELLLEELTGYTRSLSVASLRDQDLVGFLIEWFAFHTAGDDIRLASYVRQGNSPA